jgi:hypothetical protein
VPAAESNSIATPLLLLFLLGAGIIYTFGYLRAVMHRANQDYKTVKANLPKLRRGFWAAWWAAVKVGFWLLLGVAALITWAWHQG